MLTIRLHQLLLLYSCCFHVALDGAMTGIYIPHEACSALAYTLFGLCFATQQYHNKFEHPAVWEGSRTLKARWLPQASTLRCHEKQQMARL